MLLVGVIVRTLPVNIPAGIFFDEAMSGYDAWCLAYYGVDQHLTSYPVYLRSWGGGGMNALYAYISIPFIKCFGLSLPVFRLPMALVSCFSLLLLYYTLRKTSMNYLLIFFIMFLMIVNPWHIMKSRWALESNIAPDIILIGICFLILGYNSISDKKKRAFFFAGFFFLALSAYGYAVTWFMLPLFCLFLFVFLYKKRKIRKYEIGLYSLELLILVFPLILFAFLILTNGEQFRLGLTITTLEENRHNSTTLFGEGDFLPQIVMYLKKIFNLLILGDDTYRWNTFYLFGQFYNILLIPPILIFSFYLLRKRKYHNISDSLFILWLMASVPIVFLVEPNVNHWNVLWFPLIYFTGRGGLYFCAEKYYYVKYLIIGGLILLFVMFSRKYITFFGHVDTSELSGFVGEYEGGFISFAKTKEFDRIYFDGSYPMVLFYNPVSPYIVASTKKKRLDSYNIFNSVEGYDKFRFYLPSDNIEPTPPKTAYILRNYRLKYSNIDVDKYNIDKGEVFFIIWNE